MTEIVEPRSAKIYAFPPRGRFARGLSQDAEPLPKTSIGDAWYHDEAIREAATEDRSRSR